jgi:hypothetical protein
VICFCSIISVISASNYVEVDVHGFVKLFKFFSTRKCTLTLTLDGAFHGATKHGYKRENIIDFVKGNSEL